MPLRQITDEDDANTAWFIQEWIAGQTQVKIADRTGVTPGRVCGDIVAFINKWLPGAVTVDHYNNYSLPVYNNDRKKLAMRAMQKWFMATGKSPCPPPPGPYFIGEADYQRARKEHAFLLRCEGNSYWEIGRRLGYTPQQARVQSIAFGQRVGRAIRRANWTIRTDRKPIKNNFHTDLAGLDFWLI